MKPRYSTLMIIGVAAAYYLSILPLNQVVAQDDHRGMRVQQATPTERRVALVIGNSAYRDSPLSNPVNDARDMAAALRGLGFEVIHGENLSQNEMKRQIRSFGEKIPNGGVGLFYYAGHGIQIKGSNYLIPVDANIVREEEVEYESVDVGLVLAQMEAARNRLNIVILDACRNNPFARRFRSPQKGLASIDAPSGTLIAYATAPGSVASDGAGKNGLYTQELLKQMRTPNLSIEQVFKQVRIAVRNLTQGRQIPWEASSLVGDFYFSATEVTMSPSSPTGTNPNKVRVASPPSLRRFEFETVTTDSTTGAVTNRWKGEAQYFTDDITGVTLVMVEIPTGTFQMGTPKVGGSSIKFVDKNDKTLAESQFSYQKPQHTVTVPKYYMGKYEVTQAQWRAVSSLPKVKKDLELDPSSFKGDNLPVDNVLWDDAVEFCERLSKATGRQYRLPSEAEWEYACRAGTTTEFAFGDKITSDLVNFRGDTYYNKGVDRQKPTSVGELGIANAFGLFDMHGNVWEWCMDTWHKNYNGAPNDGSVWEGGDTQSRILRGGSYQSSYDDCSAGRRLRFYSKFNKTLLREWKFGFGVGFRVVLATGAL